jgi:hypothetical protein
VGTHDRAGAGVIHLHKGQRVVYYVHKWAEGAYERVERRGTVSKVEAQRVRVSTDFGPCLVWMPRGEVRPL